jgi:hypothetical protein
VGLSLLLVFLCAVFLVSCAVGSGSSWFRSLLGIDVSSYRAEKTVATLPNDGTVASELCASVEILTSGSVRLTEFRSTSDAVRIYRDELLNSLMLTNYSAYVGNDSLNASISASYPHLNAPTAIPASDFENAALRYFGATSVSNKNGALFSYLSRASCYIAPSQARALSVSVTPLSLEETENTYRLTFSLENTNGETASYLAMFVKRPNGSAYMKLLEEM